MVFIKGAWVDLCPWDERYHEYYCCSGGFGLNLISHCETFDPATGRGEKHDPPCWITFHCARADNREIPVSDNDESYHKMARRPDWCPLRGESR
jgi:hypothetical protein